MQMMSNKIQQQIPNEKDLEERRICWILVWTLRLVWPLPLGQDWIHTEGQTLGITVSIALGFLMHEQSMDSRLICILRTKAERVYDRWKVR